MKFKKYFDWFYTKSKMFSSDAKSTKPTNKKSKNQIKNTLHSFHAEPQETISSCHIAGATVMITPDHQYLVNEPQFLDEKSVQAYEKIINYKQIRKYDDESITIKNLLKSAEIAASELGLSDEFNKNYNAFEYYLNRDVLGYGILNVLMNDREHLEDITCSDWRSVGVIDLLRN